MFRKTHPSAARLLPAARRGKRGVIVVGALWVLLGGAAAEAGPLGLVTPDHWMPHEAVGVLERVTLKVHWFETMKELRAAAEGREVSGRYLHGFSILSRNKATGDYHCDVFVLRMRGALVDKDRTITFGHEVLHCFGLSHD